MPLIHISSSNLSILVGYSDSNPLEGLLLFVNESHKYSFFALCFCLIIQEEKSDLFYCRLKFLFFHSEENRSKRLNLAFTMM